MKSEKTNSIKTLAVIIALSAVLLLLFSIPAMGRMGEMENPKPDSRIPLSLIDTASVAIHNIGNLALSVTNIGILGTGIFQSSTINGGTIPSCEYPIDSHLEYLFTGAYWIGGIISSDTLTSVGIDGWVGVLELNPDTGDAGKFTVRTNNPASPYYSPDAVSEVDFIVTVFDTLTDTSDTGVDPTDARPHMPLTIQLTQKSYSWSQPDLDDFVIFDCYLKNFGQDFLTDVWIGLYIDGDALHVEMPNGWTDDLTGFFTDRNMAFITDNDGDPNGAAWDTSSVRAAMGLRFHGADPAATDLNYNWWLPNGDPSFDFGPRLAGTPEDPFRSFGAHLGTPTGDKNKHYILSHKEIDYDQIFTNVSHASEGFLDPPALAQDYADGHDTRFLLSFGPYDLNPGDSVRFFYSIVMGDNVHVNPEDFATYFNSTSPQDYLDHLDFSHLLANADVADSIFQDITDFPVDINNENGTGPIADIFSLSDNYPNPFNPSTTIEYTIARQSHVELTVFDLLGRKVRTLVDGNKPAGTFTAVWDGIDATGRRVASGIYFYRLKTEDFTETKKMVLLK